ncbi:histidine kinase [Massilia forsythiae]|uniref:Histidine kinase n=1 Tax=Massilia forsythiae TaxID=2728020 RepID=A0A7Z2VXP6_9BURK|nr:histidine kinase [Massilia forsythiae]QJE00815.1 histidine kinase [Massilia forsythiae]
MRTDTSMPAPPGLSRSHPLEVIAPFRRWPPSAVRNLVYTALWNSLIGLAIALFLPAFTRISLPFAPLLARAVLTSNVVGFMVHTALILLRRLAPSAGRRSLPLRACEILVMAVCAVLGIALSDALVLGADPFAALLQSSTLAPLLPFGVGIALLMIAVLAAGERRLARETLAAQQQERIAEAGRLLAEARLRALQAQIEPHFLYNTLANVVSLIGPAPQQARHMLERLIDFLRASLAASRAQQASVGAELDLAGAYLDVLAVRLSARLRHRIEVDAACRALPLAPMLVQPLVENAVMHGIEPKVAGGEIVVRATLDRDAAGGALLRIEVADDGAGLHATATHAVPRRGGGVGLANLRERLHSLYGDAARLQLLENAAGGVTSRLLLPLVEPPNPLPEVRPSTPSAP